MMLNRNLKLILIFLIIAVLLLIGISQNYRLLRDSNYYNYEDVSSIKSNQSITSIDETTPYGSYLGNAPSTIQGEQNYFEWSINTLYGPGFTWYMMNDTEFWDMTALPSPSRTRGNFSYTALLSDEEESASGKFYPLYADTWWFVSINHYTGYSCSVEFTNYWKDDFIKITAPTSSSSWTINTSHDINWTWGGDFAFVDIDLYYDEIFLNTIVNNFQNNGFYEWKIPTNISEFDDLYQIKISNSDYPETWNISATYFRIEYPKSITITNPSIANSWKTKELHYITWASTGDIPNVKIELFNYSTFAIIIIPSTLNDGNFSWTIESWLEDSAQYQIKISDASNTSIYTYSDHFEIETPKSISIINPSSISLWKTKELYYITWSSTGDIPNVKIELFNYSTFAIIIIPSTPNDGNFSWTIEPWFEDSTQYQIKISDASNDSICGYSDHFEITSSATPPNIPLIISGFDLLIVFSTLFGCTLLLYRFKISHLRK